VYIKQVGSYKSTLGNTRQDSSKSHNVSAVTWVKKNSPGKFDRLNFEASCTLYYAHCMKHLHIHSCEWTQACELASCTCGFNSFKSCVRFDKARLWFGFTFISLFTAPTMWSTHNSSMPPLHSFNILHLAEARCYGCNGTYQYWQLLLLYTPKPSRDLTTFSQKQ
jgi:hypothetical protein